MSKLECVCSVGNMIDKACNWKVDVLVGNQDSKKDWLFSQKIKTKIASYDIEESLKEALCQLVSTGYYTTLIQKGVSYEEIATLLKEKLHIYHNRPHRYNVVNVLYSEIEALENARNNIKNNQAFNLEMLYPTMELLDVKTKPNARR